MGDFLKIFGVFISCVFFFGKLGVPSAIILFKFDFLKVFLVTVISGWFSNVVFTLFSSAILKWWEAYKIRKNYESTKKAFTKGNRRIINIKKRFGLVGLAFITPIFPGIAIGAFIAQRFYKNKFKVIMYLNVSVVFWSLALYFLFYFFKHNIV
ncbi:MAG: hypothetical protein KBG47_00645 [Bacteroidia bacterium]|jgi:hypothetical protein|nr:hypothetical protein [Sphingobacteriaceae bacterium]MBK7310019.1 hypothetical protein [Sphingobacteriaceae bacterium]MBK7818552.1 hypothetical protein [Sphingobacteriaceae bacterium]MBP9067983.1 hypothetical protein [Bacteroidia bacterium]